jgi:hypothetical protein
MNRLDQGTNDVSDFPPSTSAGTNSRRYQKSYACAHEGCGKVFTRSDHLQRHSLNHGTGQCACDRCSAVFNRPDLLERHMARHRQKDEEAGGYGLGVVETRKRMWRDADGNIVAKRPTLPNNNPTIASQQENRRGMIQQHENTNHGYEMHSNAEPLSPPRSMTSSDSNGRGQQQIPDLVTMDENQWNAVSLPSLTNNGPEICEFLANSSWGSQPSRSSTAVKDTPFDDMFNPDTGTVRLSVRVLLLMRI